ncbi:hypothetical protein B9Z55_025303 [Caenorhabditis nigoni]|uniref:Uncharacterized protein n=1 Tax=Caenorhabditis nigoni TaxID=1611254 RepID=A0A2G5SYD7_9PELO|nr:hypothetical protein B9Z55_025303 [Caenorhabditis nigoni]
MEQKSSSNVGSGGNDAALRIDGAGGGRVDDVPEYFGVDLKVADGEETADGNTSNTGSDYSNNQIVPTALEKPIVVIALDEDSEKKTVANGSQETQSSFNVMSSVEEEMELLKDNNDDGEPLVDMEAAAAELLDGELSGDSEVDPNGLNEGPNGEEDAGTGATDDGLEGDADPISAVAEAEVVEAVVVDSEAEGVTKPVSSVTGIGEDVEAAGDVVRADGAEAVQGGAAEVEAAIDEAKGDAKPVAAVTGIVENVEAVGDVARAYGSEAVQAGDAGAKAIQAGAAGTEAAIDGAKGDTKPVLAGAGGAAAEAAAACRQNRQRRQARQAAIQVDDGEMEVIRDDVEKQGIVPELSLQASTENAVRKATREMRSEIRALRNEVRNYVAEIRNYVADGIPVAPGVGLPLAQGAGTSNGVAAPPPASTNEVEGAEEGVEDDEDINDEEDELMDKEEPEDVIDVDDEEPAPKKAKQEE